jgi:hypothetical protein
MAQKKTPENLKIRAHSPGKYPILIVERASGNLLAAYFETGYDLNRAKPVEEDWVRENAIGRHSFIEVDPPKEIPATSLAEYARRELLGEH